ncbi:hypothetical protein A9K97_gp334 [Tokyovirus A1]|uniref:hypothetical protein n=1 Tax=Tokyovirus A1 TaxID=1826170 RepID=UPI0007A96CDC|nr:hypothetical protein A9K97_gp334 [Tokyovirus A1]BAU80017.1 hypothetical protein [Tokyovirus A1]
MKRQAEDFAQRVREKLSNHWDIFVRKLSKDEYYVTDLSGCAFELFSEGKENGNIDAFVSAIESQIFYKTFLRLEQRLGVPKDKRVSLSELAGFVE